MADQDIFDWDAFRYFSRREEPTRDGVMKKAFSQWIAGNDSFKDKNSVEMSDYFHTFRSAWIIAEMFMK